MNSSLHRSCCGPVAAEVLDQRVVPARLAAQDQPVDLLADLLLRASAVHVHREVVGALEAGLHRDPVHRLVVTLAQAGGSRRRREGCRSGVASRRPRTGRPPRAGTRCCGSRSGCARGPVPSIASSKATTSSHRYSWPVSGSTAMRGVGPSQLRKPSHQLVERAPRLLPDRLAAAEQHRAHEERAQPTVARRVRSAVRGQELKSAVARRLDRSSGLGRAPRLARLIDERLQARVGERPLAQRLARVGVEERRRATPGTAAAFAARAARARRGRAPGTRAAARRGTASPPRGAGARGPAR